MDNNQPIDRDTYTMNSTYVVMDRLKLITKVTTLRELSAKLKISYDILRNRCGRNSMPYKEVVTFCYQEDIDVNDLLFNWSDIDTMLLAKVHHGVSTGINTSWRPLFE